MSDELYVPRSTTDSIDDEGMGRIDWPAAVCDASEFSRLRSAAECALNRNWHIFGCAYRTKLPFKDTRGSRDARNDKSALSWWNVETDKPANPAVRLDKSNLTILDIDEGLVSEEDAIDWAISVGLPATYMVVSGRKSFGCHFYFQGVRTLPNITGKAKDGKAKVRFGRACGDLICHGHVIVAGGLHKSGQYYRAANDLPIAPLPEFLRNYIDHEKAAKSARFGKADSSTKQPTKAFVEPSDESEQVIPLGHRNGFLVREAGHLRWRGGNEEAIYQMLKDICRRFCVDGEQYATSRDSELRRLAQWTCTKPCTRHLKTTGLVIPVRLTDTDRVVAVLKERYPSGHKSVTKEDVLAEMAETFPELKGNRMKLQRAMVRGGFTKVGRHPQKRRQYLWKRTD